jgi:hypothetical protein
VIIRINAGQGQQAKEIRLPTGRRQINFDRQRVTGNECVAISGPITLKSRAQCQNCRSLKIGPKIACSIHQTRVTALHPGHPLDRRQGETGLIAKKNRLRLSGRLIIGNPHCPVIGRFPVSIRRQFRNVGWEASAASGHVSRCDVRDFAIGG